MSAGPNASWHPAMMPNSLADLTRHEPIEIRRTDSLPHEEEVAGLLAPPHDQSSQDERHDTNLDPEGWFPNYGEDSNGHQSGVRQQPSQALFQEQHIKTEQSEAVEPGVPELLAQQEAGLTAKSSKHFSTGSFTRTVPYEVNWSDDGDVEFPIESADTDPFISMPPNDRTNSFPPILPVDNHDDPIPEPPLPSTQVRDIMKAVELEEQGDSGTDFLTKAALDDEQRGHEGDDSAECLTSPQQYVGGSFPGTTEEASEDCFEERLPLIHHDADEGVDIAAAPVTSAAENSTRIDGPDSFPADTALGDDDFFSQINQGNQAVSPVPEQELQQQSTAQALGATSSVELEPTLAEGSEENELDAKWKDLFADEDANDFLLDETAADETKKFDPADFLGSDDEGLLDDTEDAPAEPDPQPWSNGLAAAPPDVNGHFLAPHQAAASPKRPVPKPYQPTPSTCSAAAPGYRAPPTVSYLAGPHPPRPEPSKTQSFVTQSKGGYSSPYDLPMEVVLPKKRASARTLHRTGSHIAPSPGAQPPRSASYQGFQSSRALPTPGMPSPSMSQSSPPAAAAQKPAQLPRSKEGSFFEDLPIVVKARSNSRANNRNSASPPQASPYGSPQATSATPSVPMPATTRAAPLVPPPSQAMQNRHPLATPSSVPNVAQLVTPQRVNPYATAPATAPSSRYSSAPSVSQQPNGSAPVALRAGNLGYGVAAALPHMPRNSSPLAHFEASHDRGSRLGAAEGGGVSERRSGSSLYDARPHQIQSLPPTREVEEAGQSAQTMGARPLQPPHFPMPHNAVTTSPLKRSTSNCSPLGPGRDMAPPSRSQTQSPGTLYAPLNAQTAADPVPRPSSVHGPSSPTTATHDPASKFQVTQQYTTGPTTQQAPYRSREFSQNLNLVPPTDGREHDPLQRWHGCPLLAWGVGGTMVCMFPQNVSRYGMNQPVPMVMRKPGEVRVKTAKDLELLEDRLAKFPGPLKGKSKKKETLAWLSTGIEGLESRLPSGFGHPPHRSHEDKRAVERVLLWKMLRLFIEHDGLLEGAPAVNQAVREVLDNSGSSSEALLMSPGFPPGSVSAAVHFSSSPLLPHLQADAVDPSAVEAIQAFLVSGDRLKAVWVAADKRMWGHAFLIANTASPELYRQVTQEFIKKEVNLPDRNHESLAALYAVLSGNHEESMDELVPVHARAGLQLVTKEPTLQVNKDATEGLDKWRETLRLVLSNRSPGDAKAIHSLGNLLSGYGRAEAAHICFMFSRNHTVFGGLDEPNCSFVLVGSDHRRQPEQFAKELEPLLLSEVYEYGLSLGGGSGAVVGSPHLAAYKLQHARVLAEHGYRDKALQYCDVLSTAMTSQTRRAAYHHVVLEAAVEDLAKRLRQAPSGESNSWISKPNMNKVSDSVWNRFNKFVSGEDSESPGPQNSVEGVADLGPFAQITGGTPNMSRSPSTTRLDQYGPAISGCHSMPTVCTIASAASASAPAPRANSRYTPAGPQSASASYGGSNGSPYEPNSSYAPRSSMERTSGELNRGSFDSRRSLELSPRQPNPYAPSSVSSSSQGYKPFPTAFGPGLGMPQETTMTPVFPPQPQNLQPSRSVHQPLGYTPSPALNGTYAPLTSSALSTGSESVERDQSSPSVPSAPAVQPRGNGYEPLPQTPYAIFASAKKEAPAADDPANGGSYEAPCFQPYHYEPPSYEAMPDSDSDEKSKLRPKKKKGIMYDHDDDDDPDELSVPKQLEKSKEEKDRENADMFRKIAEEEAKKAAEAKQTKKSSWLGGWFGSGKKAMPQDNPSASSPNKPIRAKLGEANSFYYDPDLKRWVNKKATPEEKAAIKGSWPTPPPPSSGPPSFASPAAAGGTPPPPPRSLSAPFDPTGRTSVSPTGVPPRIASSGDDGLSVPPPSLAAQPLMAGSVSNTSVVSAPPSRPATGLSNSSSIDDLLAVGPRKTGAAKKGRKSGRYVDVMAKP